MGERGDGRLRTSLLIGIVCFFVYNANLRAISAGDTYPARYQPFGILRHGSLSLDPILSLVRHGRTPAETYWIQSGRGGRAISLYPVVLPVLTSPLYVPAALYLQNLRMAGGVARPRGQDHGEAHRLADRGGFRGAALPAVAQTRVAARRARCWRWSTRSAPRPG